MLKFVLSFRFSGSILQSSQPTQKKKIKQEQKQEICESLLFFCVLIYTQTNSGCKSAICSCVIVHHYLLLVVEEERISG